MMRRLSMLLTLAAFLGGCAAGPNSNSASGTTNAWYSVTVNQTPFYLYGPQQGNGPDEQLPKDSIMKVIQSSFGYMKVQLQDGKDGYVARKDIRLAPMTLVAAKLGPPPIAAAQSDTQPGHGEEFRLNSNDPRLIAPPEPLPQAGMEPTPIPQPSRSPGSP
ncbi:MAG: hypothetical protein ACRD5Z_18585 [Bryobacteraceae bacterium]